MNRAKITADIKYPPLDSSAAEIRLLLVQPGVPAAPVKCSYQVINLDHEHATPYATLSYAWGKAAAVEVIFVDSVEVKISTTLLQAFKRLRQTSEVTALWVDALCIDQEEDREKTLQVGLMHRIYSECDQVAVWLGSLGSIQPEIARAVVETVAWIASESPDLPLWVHDRVQSGSIADGLKVFINAPWWRRIWTVQEIMLPKRATMYWGPSELAWKHLDRAAEVLKEGGPWFRLPHDFRSNGSLGDLASVVNGLRIAKAEGMVDLLFRWRYRDATDPRDKVYGLTGLRRDKQLPCLNTCGYDTDVATLYTRVTVDMINDRRCLIPLVGRRVGQSKIDGLPSWACDWSWNSSNWWVHRDIYVTFGYTADRGLFGVGEGLRLTEDGQTLILSGVLVGKVAVAEEWNPRLRSQETESSLLPSAQRRCRMLTTKYQAWLDTQSPPPTILADWSDDLDKIVAGILVPGDTRKVHAKDKWLTEVINKQVLFITEQGYCGVGPIDIEPGHEVWCVGGSRFPFILASLPAENNDVSIREDGVDCKFIGDAFVCGIMTGSAVDRADRHTRIRLH
jgi:hypothetical protein